MLGNFHVRQRYLLLIGVCVFHECLLSLFSNTVVIISINSAFPAIFMFPVNIFFVFTFSRTFVGIFTDMFFMGREPLESHFSRIVYVDL